MTMRERFEKLQRYRAARNLDTCWGIGITLGCIVGDSTGNALLRDDVLALADEIDRERTETADAVTDEQVTAFSLACHSPEARLAILRQWCSGCGGEVPCSCGRDE